MTQPKFLYHGGRELVETLEPMQAIGFGGDADCRKAVYAVVVREWAIPFAIIFVPTGPDAVFFVDTQASPPRIRLKNTEVRWKEKGYLYTLPAEMFEQIDDHQWVSFSPVSPVQEEEINPADFKEWIEIESA